MENLKDAGLNLRKIQVSDWASLVENLNHNFSVLLSSPLFKGISGDKGDDGDGTSGERGSRWIWAIWDDFKLAYGLSNQGQVNLNFINGQSTNDLQKLMDTLHTDSIISNDNIVLPSGQIITFDITIGQFKDSGMSFAQAQGITESRVSQMINDAISGINEGSVIYEVFKAYAKNFPDTSASSGNNNQINPDSTVDIGTPSSKVGYLLDRHKFVSMAIANMNSVQDSATFVFGAAEQYHKLIQQTQNAVGKTTNEYTPGVNETTSLAILQDNYKNGIIIGHKNANTMRDFSRIYRDENQMHLTSNYSMYENEFGEVIIRKDTIILRTMDKSDTNRIYVDSNFQVVGKARFMDDIIHTAFNVSKANNRMDIGIAQSAMPTGITYLINFKESPTFETLKNNTFLSTDANGKVKGSGYTVSQDILGITETHTHIPTALAVQNAINMVNNYWQGQIGTIQSNIAGINSNVADIKRDALHFRNTTGIPNDASLQGIYRATSTASPNNQAGFMIDLRDTSLSTKSQLAITNTDVLFRSVVGSINGIAWIKLANKSELDAAVSAITTRLNGHDADISQLSGTVTNNYTTLNTKIDSINQALTNKINQDIASTITTLRAETIQAVKGISVSGGLIKSEVGNSINIAHPTFNPTITQESNPARIITGINTNNGHITGINWVPFASTGELRYGMIIDLMAHYWAPQNQPNWMTTTVGATTFNQVMSNYFLANGKGRYDARVETYNYIDEGDGWYSYERRLLTIDLSRFVLCDGRNVTPNLTGVVTVGAGTFAAYDSQGRSADPVVDTYNRMFIPNGIANAETGSGSHYFYGQSYKKLAISELPPHDHYFNYNTYDAKYGRNGGTSTAQFWADDKNARSYTETTGNGEPFATTPLSYAVFKVMFVG